MERSVSITTLKDNELKDRLSRLNVALSVEELRRIAELIGRDPTITELYIFDAEWSEHCSYKSSKKLLAELPKKAPYVVSTEDDAGIVELCEIDGKRYCLVVAHESHNHPSQLLPYEGAATGIGGIVRDVNCMGADVVGVCDPLRFGSPDDPKIIWLALSVIEGIGGYSNPLGVPNLGGDIYFSSCYNENCLVNVVGIGIVPKDEIIPSKLPESAKNTPYYLILIGKPTDASGFGGASFASKDLEEKEQKEAVQVPDPFLKNVLAMNKANKSLFNLIKEEGSEIAMKDLGGGGLACASSEMCRELGCEIDLDKVPQVEGLNPETVACAETQERYLLAVPESIVEDVLKIYNKDWELSAIFTGARAEVIGKTRRDKKYILRHKGEVVCDLAVDVVTSGITYDREKRPVECEYAEPDFDMPNLEEGLLKLLSHPNIADKSFLYSSYDMEVQGKTVIRPGEADASLIVPLIHKGSSCGVAVSCDGNPFYCEIDPYWGAVNAVAESVRNVVSIGAEPLCITDCLNYGNPEKPEVFWQFAEGVRGIAYACKILDIPVVSGNVSFYNESERSAIYPSPIVACFGKIGDYKRAVTMELKSAGNLLYLIGERKDELGGSVYYQTLGLFGKNLPKPDLAKEKNVCRRIIEFIRDGAILSCHDISDGGMITAIAEMAIGSGLSVDLELKPNIRMDKFLFTETPGFIIEVLPQNRDRIEDIFSVEPIGKVTEKQYLSLKDVFEIPMKRIEKVYKNSLKEILGFKKEII